MTFKTTRSAAQPFSLPNRLARACWGLTWVLMFRVSPRPCHGWRRLLLRLWGARIGRGVRVYPSAWVWAPWNLTMDEGACLGDQVDCYCQDHIHIGAKAVVSQRAFLCCGTHDYTATDHPLITGPISIGERAWICAQAIIGPGVTVAAGCVIGAGAVAMRDQPAWMVCGGNPCVALKPRVLTPPANEPT